MVTPLVRALYLLEVFRPGDTLLGNQEMSVRSGLPRSTVSRMAQSLTSLGYLQHDPLQRKFRLAAPVLSLGYAAIRNSELLRLAVPRVRALVEHYRLYANLSTRDRLEMIVMDGCGATAAPSLEGLQVGTRLGLATSPVGWALLAGLPEAERDYLLDKLESHTLQEWPQSRRGCEDAIALGRQKGFCTALCDWNPELRMVAVPVIVPGYEPLVLSCIGLAIQMKLMRIERELGPHLVALASELQREVSGQRERQGVSPPSCADSALSRDQDAPASGSTEARMPAQSREEVTPVATVERGLRVLRCFRASRMPLSHTELVSRSALPKATVSRLTSTLMRMGFLKREAGGRRFELSAGVLPIGHAFLEANTWVRQLQPLMQSLAEELNVSVALATGDRKEMLYVGYCISQRIATLRLGVGSMLPMATTAIGHAWLWGVPEAEREVLLEALCLDAGTDAGALARRIRSSFAELSSRGVCSVMGGFQRDAFGIALPVHIGVRKETFALSCGAADVGLDLEKERERIAPSLRRAASQLERMLADLGSRP
jgi:DNA-binding IclR family transcriptional regulator